jgi:DNA-binding SARP family transcriptional activator/predicted ATPase
MADELQLVLLGPLEARRAGTPVTGFTSTKVQALLCYLAVTGQPHLRPSLAGLLWGQLPEANAQNNLRKALSNLRRLVGPHLAITRQAVAFKRDSAYWLDVEAFESLAGGAAQPAIQRLAEAVALYRGDFLDGFYVRQAPVFEAWVLARRARLREMAVQALHTLVVHHTWRGKAGYPVALDHVTRLLALEPWREEAHRQLMLLLALSGRRGAALAQYETCRQVLGRELGVEPGTETVRLYEQIRDERVALIPRLPRYLQEDAPQEAPPVFVARQRALERLDGLLDAARAGRGQVAFVTGGPGRGKTALLAEFARRAMAAHPHLLVAGGRCNALAGVGDPYLPFREVLGMLTGDVEARWAAGSISRDHAWRLWGALPLAARALLARGPHIPGTLLDGPALLSRATVAAASPGTPWLQRLRARVEGQPAPSGDLETEYLLEQVTNVLRRLAEDHPLLLIVDDLQWADASSIGLMFHLGRRLPGSRILLIGAYRPEEVASSPQEDRPLAKVLAELKGQFGDAWIDLARVEEAEGRGFVDALLDTEPNRLGRAFREALFRRTAGHPLFTIELLRTMQEKGELLQDEDGCWFEGPALNWEALPARVEGAIEQRVRRLKPELQALLAVASVEGEEFTAQVVATVQGQGERQVLQRLSGELERRHRLVRASDEMQPGPQRLSHYRFAHALFRDYVYETLSPGERRLLHREVGTALEGLYGDRVGDIAARLAVHFAGHREKERHYARLAGQRAAAQYANEEAVRHLSRALALTPEAEHEARYALLLAREQVYHRQGDRQAQQQDLAALEDVAETLADPQKRATVSVRRAEYAYLTGDAQAAIAAARRAVDCLQIEGDPALEAEAHRLGGIAEGSVKDFEARRLRLEQGLALARRAEARWLEAEILRQLSWAHALQGQHDRAAVCVEASLSIFQEVGDQHDQMRIRHNLAAFAKMHFKYQQARTHWEEGLRLSRELGARLFEATMLHSLGTVLEACGAYAMARQHCSLALSTARDIGARTLAARARVTMGCTSYALGESAEALSYIQDALALARETGERYLQARVLTALGHCLGTLGQLEEARAAYQEALSLRREMGHPHEATEAQAGLARVCLAGGDPARAMGQVEDILTYLESGTLEGTEQPLLVYLSCYRVLQAVDDPRAKKVLDEAVHLLQDIAAKITDDDLRHSFLQDVPAHREIASAHKRRDQYSNA